jgi:STE24 endopeptidase
VVTTRRKAAAGLWAAGVWLGVLSVALALALWLLVPWAAMPPATDAELHRSFSDSEIARGDRFAAQARPPSYLSLLVGLAVVAWLTLTRRGLGLLRRVLRGPWWLQVPTVVVTVTAAAWLVTLPADVWREMVLREWGLSTQTWGSWLLDGLKGLGITVGLTSLGMLLLVWLARRMPRWWFLPASLAAIVVSFATSFAYPVLIEPVFNTFTPMAAGELRTSLLEMADRDGVQVEDVLVADASRRTTSLNAYVSGFGATRRIVVYDTLLEEATPAEIEAIVAHELGHADNDDVLTGTALSGLAGAVGLTLLWWVLRSGWVRRRGVAGAGDPLAAAVVLGLATVVGFALNPVTNGISREVELRADRHALELSRDPETLVAIQQRLALNNIADLTPPRWSYLMFASHPSAVQRIALARDWAEENL